MHRGLDSDLICTPGTLIISRDSQAAVSDKAEQHSVVVAEGQTDNLRP